jgi:hypothetical protein
MKATIYLPIKFWTDHAERGLQAGECIGVYAKREAIVSCTEAELAAIEQDAKFYAEGNVDGVPGLVASAKRTLKAIAAFRDKRRSEVHT